MRVVQPGCAACTAERLRARAHARWGRGRGWALGARAVAGVRLRGVGWGTGLVRLDGLRAQAAGEGRARGLHACGGACCWAAGSRAGRAHWGRGSGPRAKAGWVGCC
jgi:hypothetical protein